MAFETFRRRFRPSPKEPTVTLSTTGTIGLNTRVAKTLIGDSGHALLLFDREKSLMGIKFINKTEPDSYPVKKSASGTHASLSGVAFMKNYGIYPEKTAVYAATFDPDSKLLTIDLSGAVKGGRKKKIE
jgi:hypothetical protein